MSLRSSGYDFDDSDYSEEELITALQDSIADTLNIHSSDVEIAFDPTSNMIFCRFFTNRAKDVDSFSSLK